MAKTSVHVFLTQILAKAKAALGKFKDPFR
jgi:hypothetical protein